jgi:NAD dependent epimerase/dehydratase family enzyme
MPAAVVRVVFGELGQALLLDGARVSSSVLERSGFRFLFHDVESALRAELGQVDD